MSVFTKQFVNADEYEEWLRGAGERINVLSITSPAGGPIYKPRQLWIRSPSTYPAEPLASEGQNAGGAITVKYQTSDRTLAPASSRKLILIQIALVAAGFFALFTYVISKF